MKKPIIHFIISALLGLGIGYLAFDVIAAGSGNDTEVASDTDTTTETSTETNTEETTPEATETATAGEENILQSKGCIGCHAVEGLDLQGGATGPDLSQAYANVEGKHGKPLDEFLKEPTSAVMSTVIAGSPLTDEEITQIVEELQKASEN